MCPDLKKALYIVSIPHQELFRVLKDLFVREEMLMIKWTDKEGMINEF